MKNASLATDGEIESPSDKIASDVSGHAVTSITKVSVHVLGGTPTFAELFSKHICLLF